MPGGGAAFKAAGLLVLALMAIQPAGILLASGQQGSAEPLADILAMEITKIINIIPDILDELPPDLADKASAIASYYKEQGKAPPGYSLSELARVYEELAFRLRDKLQGETKAQERIQAILVVRLAERLKVVAENLGLKGLADECAKAANLAQEGRVVEALARLVDVATAIGQVRMQEAASHAARVAVRASVAGSGNVTNATEALKALDRAIWNLNRTISILESVAASVPENASAAVQADVDSVSAALNALYTVKAAIEDGAVGRGTLSEKAVEALLASIEARLKATETIVERAENISNKTLDTARANLDKAKEALAAAWDAYNAGNLTEALTLAGQAEAYRVAAFRNAIDALAKTGAREAMDALLGYLEAQAQALLGVIDSLRSEAQALGAKSSLKLLDKAEKDVRKVLSHVAEARAEGDLKEAWKKARDAAEELMEAEGLVNAAAGVVSGKPKAAEDLLEWAAEIRSEAAKAISQAQALLNTTSDPEVVAHARAALKEANNALNLTEKAMSMINQSNTSGAWGLLNAAEAHLKAAKEKLEKAMELLEKSGEVEAKARALMEKAKALAKEAERLAAKAREANVTEAYRLAMEARNLSMQALDLARQAANATDDEARRLLKQAEKLIEQAEEALDKARDLIREASEEAGKIEAEAMEVRAKAEHVKEEAKKIMEQAKGKDKGEAAKKAAEAIKMAEKAESLARQAVANAKAGHIEEAKKLLEEARDALEKALDLLEQAKEILQED